MIKQVHILVSGTVQGVCFRMYTCDQARSLGLSGWVRNRPEGTVEIMAEGEETDLRQLIKWCHSGPSYASVQDVQVDYSEAAGGFDAFQIRY